MSRSVKKVPGFTDRNPFMKNFANKRLRAVATRVLRNQYVQEVSYETLVDDYRDYRDDWDYWDDWDYYYKEPYYSFYDPSIELSRGNYKRYTCPWDICDWKWLYWDTQEIKEYCDGWDTPVHRLYSK